MKTTNLNSEEHPYRISAVEILTKVFEPAYIPPKSLAMREYEELEDRIVEILEENITNEDYDMLARENEQFAKTLKRLGYTDNQISDIANGAI